MEGLPSGTGLGSREGDLSILPVLTSLLLDQTIVLNLSVWGRVVYVHTACKGLHVRSKCKTECDRMS